MNRSFKNYQLKIENYKIQSNQLKIKYLQIWKFKLVNQNQKGQKLLEIKIMNLKILLIIILNYKVN